MVSRCRGGKNRTMNDKQMEGDNRRRRTLAREARQQGLRPSEAGATLGSSKQPEHLRQAEREGPPPAGPHKPGPQAPARPTPRPPGPAWPRPVPEPPPAPGVRYRELVSEVGRRTGLDFDHACQAAEATVTVLARALADADRQRLLRAVPAELHDDYAVDVPSPQPRTLDQFIAQVSRIAHRPADQTRYEAQAVLSTLAQQDHDLIESLDLPPAVRDLVAPLPTGGGLVDPGGRTPPLTDEELRDALVRLPRWSGDRRALARTITLPPANLDRVLGRLDGLRRELGRGAHIARPDPQNATLVVRTNSVDAVTARDVELAHRIDSAIDEAAAGIA
jgi:uncharacterized protein (DUF2267 family)